MTADRLGTIAEEMRAKSVALIMDHGNPLRRTDAAELRDWAARIAAIAALTPAAGGMQLSLIGCAHLIEKNHPEVARVLRQHAAELVAAPAPPPADAVRALVGKWRTPTPQDECTLYTMGQRSGRHTCASELQAALSAAPAGEDSVAELVATVDRIVRERAAPTPEGREGWTCECGQRNASWADECGRCERKPPPDGAIVELSVCEAHGKPQVESLTRYACGCSVHQYDEGSNTIRPKPTQQEGGRHG